MVNADICTDLLLTKIDKTMEPEKRLQCYVKNGGNPNRLNIDGYTVNMYWMETERTFENQIYELLKATC